VKEFIDGSTGADFLALKSLLPEKLNSLWIEQLLDAKAWRTAMGQSEFSCYANKDTIEHQQ
jgi:hypothetical protein